MGGDRPPICQRPPHPNLTKSLPLLKGDEEGLMKIRHLMAKYSPRDGKIYKPRVISVLSIS